MRLIDADANVVAIRVAIKRMKQSDNSNWLEGYLDGLDAACNTIEASPTIEAVTVKHGRWETDQEDVYWGNSLKRKHRTNCKKRPHFDKEEGKFILSDYCPNCGAKMDGE